MSFIFEVAIEVFGGIVEEFIAGIKANKLLRTSLYVVLGLIVFALFFLMDGT